MNGLSWFLYFADVMPNVSSVLGFFIFWLVILVFLVSIASVIVAFADDEVPPKLPQVLVAVRKWTFSLTAVATLIWVAIPSKETIYMIAGSEAGEFVVSTPEAQEILSDIREVIKLQIQDLKGDSKTTN